VDRFDFSAQAVTREFELSLQRLKTDYVDLLQIHDVEFGSVSQIIEETVPALRLLQQQGKVRFLGITGYWPGLLARIAEFTPIDTVLNYCHFNLLMNDMDKELTPVVERMKLGLMNASPLHMGLLGGNAIPSWHPAPPAVKKIARELVALCRAHSVIPATLALNACLRHRTVSSTFIGFSSVAEVEESLQALDFEPPPDLTSAIACLVAQVFNTAWPSGLAENQPDEVFQAR
jgi:L-galactose dehydrogenase